MSLRADSAGGHLHLRGAGMARVSAREAEEIIATAAELADAAREATLLHFRRADLAADTVLSLESILRSEIFQLWSQRASEFQLHQRVGRRAVEY